MLTLIITLLNFQTLQIPNCVKIPTRSVEAWVPPLAASLQDDSVVASFVFFSSLQVKIDETLVQIYTEETLLKGSSYSTHKEAKSKR